MEKQLDIGSKVYLVHRSYVNKKGGRLVLAKVKTYQNITGIVEPIFYEVGKKQQELTLNFYLPFTDLQKAIDAISIKSE